MTSCVPKFHWPLRGWILSGFETLTKVKTSGFDYNILIIYALAVITGTITRTLTYLTTKLL